MKKAYLLLLFCLLTVAAQAQTTLTYSNTAVYSYFGFPAKIGGIGQNIITTGAVSDHHGLMGIATNSSVENIGVVGTTRQSTVGSAYSYAGVYGDSYNNNLNVAARYVYGSVFRSRNSGANSTVNGVYSSAEGSNTTSQVIGVESTATNTSNTAVGSTIAVRGITYSGSSNTSNYLKDLANPGGYFSSNDGQGIYATTLGTFNWTGNKVSQAITGYSNQTGAYLNAGVVGYAEGTGIFKYGVYGYLKGTAGSSASAAIYGDDAINASNTYAGQFYGKVQVNGAITGYSLSISGTKNFLIDHPLDPENKVLRHAAMESNAVLNQYSGNLTTDANGLARVTLPAYFETLNKDFRYQLTVIGTFAQAIIKEEVQNNQFVVQTNQPGIKVSWQVTGVRNDKVMQQHPFVAESLKEATEKGNYLNPDAYGKAASVTAMRPGLINGQRPPEVPQPEPAPRPKQGIRTATGLH